MRSGATAQQLRVLGALSEEPVQFTPLAWRLTSAHIPVPGYLMSLLALVGTRHVSDTQTYIEAKHLYT